MAMELTALVLEDSQTQAQIIGKMLESMGWGHVRWSPKTGQVA